MCFAREWSYDVLPAAYNYIDCVCVCCYNFSGQTQAQQRRRKEVDATHRLMVDDPGPRGRQAVLLQLEGQEHRVAFARGSRGQTRRDQKGAAQGLRCCAVLYCLCL